MQWMAVKTGSYDEGFIVQWHGYIQSEHNCLQDRTTDGAIKTYASEI